MDTHYDDCYSWENRYGRGRNPSWQTCSRGTERTQYECRRACAQAQVPTNRISEILNGRRAITADTALRLGHYFGTSAEFWLNLQKLYELRLAEKTASREIKTLPMRKNEEHAHT